MIIKNLYNFDMYAYMENIEFSYVYQIQGFTTQICLVPRVLFNEYIFSSYKQIPVKIYAPEI